MSKGRFRQKRRFGDFGGCERARLAQQSWTLGVLDPGSSPGMKGGGSVEQKGGALGKAGLFRSGPAVGAFGRGVGVAGGGFAGKVGEGGDAAVGKILAQNDQAAILEIGQEPLGAGG